jgi:hypothetical protein
MAFDWISGTLVLSALSVTYTIVRNLKVDSRAEREKKEKAFAEVKAHGERCRNDFDAYKEISTQQITLLMDVVKKSTDMHVAVATLVTTQKHFETQLSEAKSSIHAVEASVAGLTRLLLEKA